MSFVIGLVGLSLMVLIHEFGHFLAARMFGVEVLKFSIGMGPKIVGKKIGGTEYLLSALPLGGYCQMKGEEDFAEAIELKAKRIDGSPGSLYGVAPWKRMVIAFAGPFFNLVSAMLLFFVINIGGYTIETTDNRIILASEFTGETDMPANKAGLRTGDRIVAVNGEKTEYFYQILEAAALNADKELTLTVDRRGDLLTVRVTPQLNPQTGGGVIGVYSFQPLEVAEVRTGSPAFEAGLRPGDVITAVDDHPVAHSIELQQALLGTVGGRTQLTVVRNGEASKLMMFFDAQEPVPPGFALKTLRIPSPPLPFGKALKAALTEPFSIVAQQIQSFAILNRVDINTALQGPIRITSMIGDSVLYSFGLSVKDGFMYTFRIIAVISVVLFFMNLLPIPALDGGLILISLIETLIRRPLPPRALSVYQTIGIFVIILLSVLVLTNEFVFYFRQ